MLTALRILTGLGACLAVASLLGLRLRAMRERCPPLEAETDVGVTPPVRTRTPMAVPTPVLAPLPAAAFAIESSRRRSSMSTRSSPPVTALPA